MPIIGWIASEECEIKPELIQNSESRSKLQTIRAW